VLVPRPRGTLSERLFGLMTGPLDDAGWADLAGLEPDSTDDAQISLWAAYEPAYRGFDDASDELEWHPPLLALRRRLEQAFEDELRARYQDHADVDPLADDLGAGSTAAFAKSFFAFVSDFDSPSLSAAIQRTATRDQVLDLLKVRSVYHLKEADPTAWTVARLDPEPKAALMAVQFDEYGCGDPNALHSHLFARGLRACGLADAYGAYVDRAPATALEQNNAMSLFGLHRRLRGAALGHLAAFEATSSVPSRRIAQGLSRLELPAEIIGYYDEHVEADAVHDQVAVRQVCGPLLVREPHLVDDVFFGAFTCMDLEARFAREQLASWAA
jgi:hypothetical protein